MRDGLIQSQEALLNTYRCRFNVDTEIVPSGCVGGLPEPAVPAAWFPDPSCRNEFRYWNGYLWTRHVGNGGVQTADRLIGSEDYPPPVADMPPDCDGGVSDIFFSGDISGPEDCPNPTGVVTAPYDSDGDGVADVCAVFGSGVVEPEPADTPTGYAPGDSGPGWRVDGNGRVVLTRLLTPAEGIEAYVAAGVGQGEGPKGIGA